MAICLHKIYTRNFLGLMKSSLTTVSEYILKRQLTAHFIRLKRYTNWSFENTYSVWTQLKCNWTAVSFQDTRLLKKCDGNLCKQFSSDTSSKGLSDDALKKKIDEISENFSESLGLLEDAKNSLGTVYFTEDMMDAEAMVNVTLNDYNILLKRLNENQKATVIRTIGLKINEMKAQLEMIREMCRE